MLWTINIALIAIGFGGIYSRIGAVESLLGRLIKSVHTPFQMVLTTILTAMFCIATMCDQYLGLIVPAFHVQREVRQSGSCQKHACPEPRKTAVLSGRRWFLGPPAEPITPACWA